MNLTQARDSVMPSTLANRLKELVEQSRRHQHETARLTAELEALQRHIASLGLEARKGREHAGRGEQEAA